MPTPSISSSPPAAAPIYVVDRTDIVRVFVDVPESDANQVQIGTKATVLVRAYRDEPLPGSVTRTSWALNSKSRTLRAEIDLPNPGSQLLPGMYADVKLYLERPAVRALPVGALLQDGERSFCWMVENGRAVLAEVETGANDGTWIEVAARRLPSSPAAAGGRGSSIPIDGSERVILGNLSLLSDGAPVRLAAAATVPADVASATTGRRAQPFAAARGQRHRPVRGLGALGA